MLFSCYVFIFTACCALPLPVQGLPEFQQHRSGAFALAASQGPGAVRRLALVGHLQQFPRGSVHVRKHLQMFLFLLQLVVSSRAHWQLVKPGEALASVTPAHAPFSVFQSGCFLCQYRKYGLSCHVGNCRVPVVAHLPSCPADASRDALNLNPCICSVLRSPKGAKAWGQHVPSVRCPGPLLRDSRWVMYMYPGTYTSQGFFGPLCKVQLLPPLPALKKKENNSIMLLIEAILHLCQVLLSFLFLVPYDSHQARPFTTHIQNPTVFTRTLAGALGIGAIRNTARMQSQAFTLL